MLLCQQFVSVTNLGASAVGDGDVALHQWTLAWINRGRGALLVFPWFPFSDNPVSPYNLLFLASYFLSAVSMYFLALHYSGDRWAAWLAGIIYGFCFFRAHHFTHLSLILNPWLPLIILLYEKGLGKTRNLIGMTLLATLQALTNWYTAFFTALILGARTLADGRKNLGRMAVVGVIAGLLILPFYLPYRKYHGAPDALLEVRYNSANSGSYLQPPFNTVLGQWVGNEKRWIWGERSTYAGYTVLLIAGIGFYWLLKGRWGKRERYLFLFYMVLGLIAFFWSLGPYFLDLGGLPSPVRIIYWIVPPLASLRAVARLAIVVMFCLAILAALVAVRLKPVYVVVLAGLFLFEHWPVGFSWDPATAEPFRMRAVDRWLKENASPEDVLLELPGYSKEDWTRESRYMLYSTQHGLKLVNGYARFYPPGYFEDQAVFATWPDEKAIQLMRKYGVDYLIVDGKELYKIEPDEIRRIQ